MRSRRRALTVVLAASAMTAALVAAGSAPSSAQPDAVPTLPTVPVHPTAPLDDLTHEAVIGIIDGRGISSLPDQDPATTLHPKEADLTRKRADLKARGIDMDVISVENFTGLHGRIRVGGRIYASVQDLQDVQAQGGTVVSEGITHTSLVGASPRRQWADTCGVQDDFYGPKGLNVQALYAYSNGPLLPEVQRDFVSKCFAWGRRYGSAPNTLRSLTTPPYILKVRSLNGGCSTPDGTCGGVDTPYQYVSREALLAWLTPEPGEIKFLQPYDALRGRYSNGQFSWRCTAGTTHWSSFTEGYCWDDVLWALDHLPRRVEVTTLSRLAAAVGRAPRQLPGVPAPGY